MHAAAIDLRSVGDFADGPNFIDFQENQNAPKEGGIANQSQLTFKARRSGAMLSSATLTRGLSPGFRCIEST
jgi:hypothetical protein